MQLETQWKQDLIRSVWILLDSDVWIMWCFETHFFQHIFSNNLNARFWPAVFLQLRWLALQLLLCLGWPPVSLTQRFLPPMNLEYNLAISMMMNLLSVSMNWTVSLQRIFNLVSQRLAMASLRTCFLTRISDFPLTISLWKNSVVHSSLQVSLSTQIILKMKRKQQWRGNSNFPKLNGHNNCQVSTLHWENFPCTPVLLLRSTCKHSNGQQSSKSKAQHHSCSPCHGCLQDGCICWKDVKSIIEHTQEAKPPTRMARMVTVKGYMTFCSQLDRDFVPFLCITCKGIHIVVIDHIGQIETDMIPFNQTATTLILFRMVMGLAFLPDSSLGLDTTIITNFPLSAHYLNSCLTYVSFLVYDIFMVSCRKPCVPLPQPTVVQFIFSPSWFPTGNHMYYIPYYA